jgi:hypothetical protein
MSLLSDSVAMTNWMRYTSQITSNRLSRTCFGIPQIDNEIACGLLCLWMLKQVQHELYNGFKVTKFCQQRGVPPVPCVPPVPPVPRNTFNTLIVNSKLFH